MSDLRSLTMLYYLSLELLDKHTEWRCATMQTEAF